MTLTLSPLDPSRIADLFVPGGTWSAVPHDVDAVRTDRGVVFLGYTATSKMLRHTGLGTGMREMFTAAGVTDETAIVGAETSVNGVEGAEHARLRAAIGSFLTPARVETFRAGVRTMIDELLEGADRAEGFDIIDDVVQHIPARFFALLLGVPQSEADYIRDVSEAAVAVFKMDPALEARSWGEEERGGWAARYLREASQDGDHLIGHLRRQLAAGALTEEEVLNAIRTLLAASTDTTQGLMTNMLQILAQHPAQWRLLREQPDLVPGAVMESARWFPAQQPIFRVASTDVDLDGILIRAGEHVFGVVPAANRDPRVFEDAETFDVSRELTRSPLNWSTGRHFCMGRMFAVMECEELLRAVTERWSEYRFLDGSDEPPTTRPIVRTGHVIGTRA